MSTSKSRPLRIATVGLGNQMKNALRLFFQGPCQNACMLASEDSAELCIVDVDGYNGTQHLQEQLKNFPKRPVIVLSLQDKVMEGAIFLRKPVKPTQLFDAIKQAKNQLLPATKKIAQEWTSSNTNTAAQSPDDPAPADSVVDRPVNGGKSLAQGKDAQNAAGKRASPSTHRAAMYLNERSANAYIGSAPDIDIENQQQIVNAQYNSDIFFQGYLKQAYSTAKSKACSVLVDCPQGSISISPTAVTELKISEQKLRSLSTVPVIEGSLSISQLAHDKPAAENGGSCIVDYEGLMWKTALWASRGRVPAGTSFTTPVMMRRWPNFTRLMVFPHVLRIAALWANEPYSLLDTARYLDIPQRNVFAFYSAAHAIGLVDMAQGETASPKEPKSSMAQGRKGLMKRIINRLRW